MKKRRRFTSYDDVKIGQEVFIPWPTEALPAEGYNMPYRRGVVVSVARNAVVVELESGGRITCQNLTSIYEIRD